jgi:hypothetical protein
MDYLFANSDRQLKLKLLHLDVWGDLFIRKIAKEKITKRLKEQISINPPLPPFER